MTLALDYQRSSVAEFSRLAGRSVASLVLAVVVVGVLIAVELMWYRGTPRRWWYYDFERYVALRVLLRSGICLSAYGLVCGLIGLRRQMRWLPTAIIAACVHGVAFIWFMIKELLL
jgi:hypothetical protein